MVHIGERMEAEAWRWLCGRGKRESSFVDATSFGAESLGGQSLVAKSESKKRYSGCGLESRRGYQS